MDVGLTYNAAAEQNAIDTGIAVQKELIFKVSITEGYSLAPLTLRRITST